MWAQYGRLTNIRAQRIGPAKNNKNKNKKKQLVDVIPIPLIVSIKLVNILRQNKIAWDIEKSANSWKRQVFSVNRTAPK